MTYETNLLANLVKVDLESQPQTLQVSKELKYVIRTNKGIEVETASNKNNQATTAEAPAATKK